jgi:hypothetical protein
VKTRSLVGRDSICLKIENVEWKVENAISIWESGSKKAMTRNQQIGAWLALTLLLALALYRWFNLP